MKPIFNNLPLSVFLVLSLFLNTKRISQAVQISGDLRQP